MQSGLRLLQPLYCSMFQPEALMFLPGWVASPLQGNPQHFSPDDLLVTIGTTGSRETMSKG